MLFQAQQVPLLESDVGVHQCGGGGQGGRRLQEVREGLRKIPV